MPSPYPRPPSLGALGQQAVAGLGIMMAPRWSLCPYLERGDLQELYFDPPLRISQRPDLAIYLLYQKQRYLVPKVKAAVDFFVARLRGDSQIHTPADGGI